MGVKKSKQILNLSHSHKLSLSDIKQSYVLIDALSFVCRWTIGSYNSGYYICDCKNNNIPEVYFIFKITIRLLSNGIIPIFVFDGNSPSYKADTLEKRRSTKNKAIKKLNTLMKDTVYNDKKIEDINKHNNGELKFKTKNEYDEYLKILKRTYKVNRTNIENAKFLLRLMGITVIDAKGEADPECAAIASTYPNDIIGIITDDFDPLMFGSFNIINLPNLYSEYFQEYKLDDILNNLTRLARNIVNNNKNNNKNNIYVENINFNLDNLIDIGCMLGTDTCSGLKIKKFNDKKEIEHILELYLKNNMNLEDTLNNIKSKYNLSDNYISKMLNSKNNYIKIKVNNPYRLKLSFTEPLIKLVKEYCSRFIESKSLENSLQILESAYKYHNYINNTNISEYKSSKLSNSKIYEINSFSKKKTSYPKAKYKTSIAKID